MNQYQLLSKIGQGSFASVYKVKRKEDSNQYALKRIKINALSDKQVISAFNEVRILASIQDPYIVSYKDSFYDQLSSSFCIVTEFLEGGDLSHFIKKQRAAKKPIKQSIIWNLAIQCLKGLKALHKINIFHRDIKSANILANKQMNIFKLGDMNVSKITDNGMAQTQTGTPYYASPQVWKQSPYTSKCDIWSLGCLLYQMATFKPPFVANDIRGLKKQIIKGQYKTLPKFYSNQLNNFLSLCLRVDPNKRLSAEELLNCQIIKQITFWKMDSPLINEQQEQNYATITKILQKIELPQKRDFHLIRDKLPKSRFTSQEKKRQNSNKQNDINNSNIFSSKITKKGQLPPMNKKNDNKTERNVHKNIKFVQERLVNL